MDVREELNLLKKYLDISTDRELAEKLGTTKGNVDSWIKRQKIPDKWSMVIGQMYENSTKNKKGHELSVSVLQAGAGEGVYNFETQHKLLSLNVEYFPYLANESSIVAIEIVGESMEPVLKQGDYILITPPKQERATEDGIYAIRVDGMIKVKLLQFMLDGTIKIISYNKEFETEIYDPRNSQIDFAIIGKKRLVISR